MNDTSESVLQQPLFQEGYEKAVDLIRVCETESGFLASPTRKDNYRRIWSRDGVIIGMTGLLIEDTSLTDTMKQTLQTLADHQGPHGEIPSNVDTSTGRVSYGGMTGRVDADLWFMVGCGEYWHRTLDDAFIASMMPVLKKVSFLMGAWEFNNRGLLYVPETGDWADEYIHNGFVLYDQLLYLQALRSLAVIHRHWHDGVDHHLKEKISRLKRLIRANYWVPFFSPHGYGYRFDSLANILVSFLDVATTRQQDAVEDYIQTRIIQWFLAGIQVMT